MITQLSNRTASLEPVSNESYDLLFELCKAGEEANARYNEILYALFLPDGVLFFVFRKSFSIGGSTLVRGLSHRLSDRKKSRKACKYGLREGKGVFRKAIIPRWGALLVSLVFSLV